MPKDMQTHSYMEPCAGVLTAALLLRATIWKQPNGHQLMSGDTERATATPWKPYSNKKYRGTDTHYNVEESREYDAEGKQPVTQDHVW